METGRTKKDQNRNEIDLLIEPAEVKPIWFSCMEESLRKSCQKKRLCLRIIQEIDELERCVPKPISVRAHPSLKK